MSPCPCKCTRYHFSQPLLTVSRDTRWQFKVHCTDTGDPKDCNNFWLDLRAEKLQAVRRCSPLLELQCFGSAWCKLLILRCSVQSLPPIRTISSSLQFPVVRSLDDAKTSRNVIGSAEEGMIKLTYDICDEAAFLTLQICSLLIESPGTPILMVYVSSYVSPLWMIPDRIG